MRFRFSRIPSGVRRHWSSALFAVTASVSTPLFALGAQGTTASDPIPALHEQLLVRARIANPALMAARARLDAARAGQRAAGAAPVTTLDADLTDGPGGDIAAGNLTLAASRPIGLGARRTAARAIAASEVVIAARELEAHERALSLVLTRELAAAVGATRVMQRLTASDAWLADAEAALSVRVATGEARYLDVLRVRTERLQLAAERADAMADRRVALAVLSAQFGAPLGNEWSATALAARVDSAAAVEDVGAWLLLLGERPPTDSLLEWADAVRAADALRQRAIGEREALLATQRAQLIGAAGVQRIGPANGGPAMGLVLGLSTTLPFTGRQGLAAAREAATADVGAASVAREAARSDARATLEAAVARDDAARERVALFSGVLVSAAESERESALTQYRNGALSLLELLDFERALLRVEVERARAIAAAAASRAALFGLEP